MEPIIRGVDRVYQGALGKSSGDARSSHGPIPTGFRPSASCAEWRNRGCRVAGRNTYTELVSVAKAVLVVSSETVAVDRSTWVVVLVATMVSLKMMLTNDAVEMEVV